MWLKNEVNTIAINSVVITEDAFSFIKTAKLKYSSLLSPLLYFQHLNECQGQTPDKK